MDHFKRVWVFLLVSLISSVSWAELGQAIPSCQTLQGEAVQFLERSSDNARFAAGMAKRDSTGQPFVMRMNYHLAPPELQQFIDRHECAHHQTGDVDRPHPPRNSPAHLMNESIADCIAILRLRDEWGGDPSRLLRLEAALSQDMAAIGFPDVSIESRLSNIRTCHAEYESAEWFISQVLADRGLSAASGP